MNCKDAQKVWGHPGGFLAGLKATYPGVLERLETLGQKLVAGATNPFHETVTRKVGPISRPYYVEHADDNEPLAHQFGHPITIGNLCCSGCGEYIGEVTLEEALAIQNAAVRTDADGSDIVL